MTSQSSKFMHFDASQDYILVPKTPSSSVSSEMKSVRAADKDEKQTQLGLATSLVSGKGTKSSKGSSLPPEGDFVIKKTNVLRRFMATQASFATGYTVTGNNLSGALGAVVYVANTTARAIHTHARIRKIVIWPSQDASAVHNSAEIRWNAGVLNTVNKPVLIGRDVPLGITNTGSLTFIPPAGTLAGAWMALGNVGATVLFTLYASEGSVVDLHVDCALFNDDTGATIALSGVTAAVGTSGYTSLNGSNGTLNQIHIPTTI